MEITYKVSICQNEKKTILTITIFLWLQQGFKMFSAQYFVSRTHSHFLHFYLLTPFLEPVSYTHLDVYKRQVQTLEA